MKIAVFCSTRMALPALQQLLEQKQLVAVGMPEKRDDIQEVLDHVLKGSGVPLQIFSRKNFAVELHDWLQHTAPDVVLVKTFGFRIPASLLNVPPLGFINFHYGLLPEMRGADPIFEVIRQRRPVTGTTIHYMDEHFDTGAIIMREEMPVTQHFTYGMLRTQLSIQGAAMCTKLLQLLQSGKPAGVPQDESQAAYYPNPLPGTVFARWNEMDTAELIALTNACNPLSKTGLPTAVDDRTVGICFASPVPLTGDTSACEPGAVLAIDGQNGLLVFTKDGMALKLEVICMDEGYFPGHYLASFGITAGMRFTDPVQI